MVEVYNIVNEPRRRTLTATPTHHYPLPSTIQQHGQQHRHSFMGCRHLHLRSPRPARSRQALSEAQVKLCGGGAKEDRHYPSQTRNCTRDREGSFWGKEKICRPSWTCGTYPCESTWRHPQEHRQVSSSISSPCPSDSYAFTPHQLFYCHTRDRESCNEVYIPVVEPSSR